MIIQPSHQDKETCFFHPNGCIKDGIHVAPTPNTGIEEIVQKAEKMDRDWLRAQLLAFREQVRAERDGETLPQIREILRQHWVFDEMQGHAHTWHDSQDAMEKIAALLTPKNK